jgi:hypothetical protein
MSWGPLYGVLDACGVSRGPADQSRKFENAEDRLALVHSNLELIEETCGAFLEPYNWKIAGNHRVSWISPMKQDRKSSPFKVCPRFMNNESHPRHARLRSKRAKFIHQMRPISIFRILEESKYFGRWNMLFHSLSPSHHLLQFHKAGRLSCCLQA